MLWNFLKTMQCCLKKGQILQFFQEWGGRERFIPSSRKTNAAEQKELEIDLNFVDVKNRGVTVELDGLRPTNSA